MGSYPTAELMGGRDEPGYQNENRELGTSIELHMVQLSGIQQLRNLFCLIRQHTREIASVIIKTVVKRELRIILPL